MSSLLIGSVAYSAPSEFPTRNVKIEVTFPPGGGTDLLARLIAAPLSDSLGQPVIVENKPGASGNIAARSVARSKPDGHTLLMVNSSYSANPALFSNLPFDPVNDLVGVSNFAYVPLVFIASTNSPYETIEDYLAAARTEGNDVFYGSCGNGTTPHLAAEMLKSEANLNLTHVPYAGCGPAVNDVLANQLESAIVAASSAMPHIQSGSIKALAITSGKRSEIMPDVPTIAESGYPDFEVNQWHGLLAPAKIPTEVVNKLTTDILQVLSQDDIKQRLADLGYTVGGEVGNEFDSIVKNDIDRFKKLADLINLKIN